MGEGPEESGVGPPTIVPSDGYSAVIVNFRTYDLVESCIGALCASSLPPNDIVVVDNESDPRLASDFSARHADVALIANTKNAGYAVACNQGWRNSKAPFVLFINPDVTVERDSVARCVEVISVDQGIGAATCRLVLPDGKLDHASHRGVPTPSASLAYTVRLNRLFPRSKTLARYTMSWLDPRTDHDVEACSGAFVLVPRAILDQIDGWDERYWFYGEDLDLCLRITKLGKRIRFIGTAKAVHIKGASSGLRRPSGQMTARELAVKRRAQRAIIEAHQQFYRQHFEASTPTVVSALIRGAFAAQRLRLRMANRLDRLRGQPIPASG